MITIADGYYLGLYFFLCALSVFGGIGILALLKLNTDKKKMLFLTPFVTQVLVALLLNISVHLGMPISSSYPILWAVLIAFGIYGFFRSRENRIVVNKWLIAGWIILPLLIMAGPYWYGSATKFGDILPDGWNYITFGQYLWKYPLGTEGGLSPLYQYAGTLSQTRFTSSAFLALFSIFFQQHDTAASSGIFLGWIIFIFAGASGFFIAEKQLSDKKKDLYVILVIFSGWVWNVLWATNFDNLLALTYVPVTIEILLNHKYLTKPWAILLGLTIAAFTLIYLELAGLIFGILIVILAIHYIQGDDLNRKETLIFGFVLGSVSLAILLPFSKWIITFLSMQFNALSTQGVRPGQGLFLGLLELKCMPSAFWAMGCEQSLQDPWLYVGGGMITQSWLLVKNILASILSLIAIIGIGCLLQRKKWDEITPLFSITLAIGYMAFIQHYSYGTYKFVLLVWWMIPYVLLLGFQYLEDFKSFSPRFVPALLYIPLLLLLLLTAFRISYIVSTKPALLSSDYAKVRYELKTNPGNPILVNVDDWLSSEWANYYLRDQDTYLNLKRMYMATNPDALNKSKKINLNSIRYVLIDGYPENIQLQDRIWEGKPYSLWKLQNDWVIPSDIQNSNGVENWAGKTGFWLGKKKAVVSYLSSFDGTVVVTGEFGPGPSLAPGQAATIKVWNNLGFLMQMKLESKKNILFDVPVIEGENQLFFQSLDSPEKKPLPRSDLKVELASVGGLYYFKDSTDWHSLPTLSIPKTSGILINVEHVNGFSHIR